MNSSPRLLCKRTKAVLRHCVRAGVGAALIVAALAATAEEASMIDCPLRDAPYSLESPLMDILLNPEAVAIVNRHMDGVLDRLPERFASTQPPSFSAILNLKMLASMAGQPPSALDAIDQELAGLAVTDADRKARCARYDIEPPELVVPAGTPRVLVFGKSNGFKDVPSVDAAAAALQKIAKEEGWGLVATENAAAFSQEILQKFDVVVWNNVSGDVLTLSQRAAFENYIKDGGGFVGIHGSGGDFIYFWDWYVDELIGARFIGHPMEPQYQAAKIVVADSGDGIATGLPAEWTLTDEWYSFASNPRQRGATVIASLDEATYSPVGRGGQDLRMGEHPIAWTRCVGDGRAFYSAIGHRPEVYADPLHLKLLEQGVSWAAGGHGKLCQAAAE